MMSNIEQLKQDYKHIVDVLCNKRLKDGIVALKVFLSKANNWELQNALEQVDESYAYMLGYMRQDIVDPKRKDLQFKLLRDTLAIADQGLYAILMMNDYGGSYINAMHSVRMSDPSQILRKILIELESIADGIAITGLLETQENETKLKEFRKRHEDLQGVLFKTIWGSPNWSVEEESVAKQLLESSLVPVNDACLIVSAITMSLLECFDVRKVTFLFDAYNHTHNKVSQRALVGLALAFQVHQARMPFYPKITSRLDLLAENDKFAWDLNRVQIQLLRSKETERITKRMQEEIIPEMLKNVNSLNMRINPDDHEDETNDIDPDWMQNIENSDLADKLREMTELQMEGADVYMGTFASLKTFPFFREIQNWFYPFSKQHSAVVSELENGTTGSRFLDAIFESPFFCDSDKYSFSQILSQIPKAQREFMVRQMLEQSSEMLMEDDKIKPGKSVNDRPEIISNQYIQDLYRFFKLYNRRYEFHDIFKDDIRLNLYPVLKDVMYKVELLKPVVQFYFNNHHYGEAIEIYRTLILLEGESAEIYQKIGYCHQKQQAYQEAIRSFLKADVLKPDTIWTDRHLATCYRMLKLYAKAIRYYQKVEKIQPENKSLLFNTGSCFVELGQYDEALRYFFKLDFIEPDNLRTWRAIAWCSFMQKRLDQAMKYYTKILTEKGLAPDYLNAGHVSLCMGNLKEALERYQESRNLSGSATLFLDIFNKDKEYLMANGIDEYDIALLYDLIR